MPPELAEAIGPVLAILGAGSMVLIGMKIRYNHLRQTRLGQGGQEEMERLTEDVATLRDEVRLLRQDSAEMYERIEFAERLLTQGRAEDADPPPGERR